MKNPFQHKLKAELYEAEPFGAWRWGLKHRPADLDEYKVKFCAHAINRHDDLVAMLRRLEFLDKGADKGDCPICHSVRGHTTDCTLAKLLREEGPEMSEKVEDKSGWREAIGAAPGFLGEVLPEEAIRRFRDGCDSMEDIIVDPDKQPGATKADT